MIISITRPPRQLRTWEYYRQNRTIKLDFMRCQWQVLECFWKSDQKSTLIAGFRTRNERGTSRGSKPVHIGDLHMGLISCLHFSVSRGVIQRKERGPAKWQLAAYNRVHNKRMADGDRPTSTVNPQRYLQTRPSGTGSLEQYKIHPTC